MDEQLELTDGIPSSAAEIDRDFATRDGFRTPERAWLLSERDVWYPNPYYTGPARPHPEDEYAYQ